jgi:hypothetical protein
MGKKKPYAGSSRFGRERFRPQHSLVASSYNRVTKEIAADTPEKKAELKAEIAWRKKMANARKNYQKAAYSFPKKDPPQGPSSRLIKKGQRGWKPAQP